MAPHALDPRKSGAFIGSITPTFLERVKICHSGDRYNKKQRVIHCLCHCRRYQSTLARHRIQSVNLLFSQEHCPHDSKQTNRRRPNSDSYRTTGLWWLCAREYNKDLYGTSIRGAGWWTIQKACTSPVESELPKRRPLGSKARATGRKQPLGHFVRSGAWAMNS